MENKLLFKAFKVVKSDGNTILFESTGEYESTIDEVKSNMIESIKSGFSSIEQQIEGKDIKEGIIIMPFIEFSV